MKKAKEFILVFVLVALVTFAITAISRIDWDKTLRPKTIYWKP